MKNILDHNPKCDSQNCINPTLLERYISKSDKLTKEEKSLIDFYMGECDQCEKDLRKLVYKNQNRTEENKERSNGDTILILMGIVVIIFILWLMG